MVTNPVTSREYKAMLKPEWFKNAGVGVKDYFSELSDAAENIDLSLSGTLKKPDNRTIRFVDTERSSIRNNHLVLRKRTRLKKQESEWTIKCRSPDRYFVGGKYIMQAAGLKGKMKFEEDIAVPFRSRFSNSNTIKFNTSENESSPDMTTLGAAAKLFPVLGKLNENGRILHPKTKLSTVNHLVAYERVYKGLILHLEEKKVTLALIVWSIGLEGRPLAAEISFRYKDKNENYSPKLCETASQLFSIIRAMDWCSLSSPTKTQYAYKV